MGAPYRVAEFFAGIGLVRLAVESAGFEVVFANDIAPFKAELYRANFDGRHFVLGDVRDVRGENVPDVDLATASFPCTDLSLAGLRAGIGGASSGMFWEFARVIEEMGDRRPRAVLLENVLGFASLHGGEDLRAVIGKLNGLGYRCDVLTLDARWFLPQSRPRLFLAASRDALATDAEAPISALRPAWAQRFRREHPELLFRSRLLPQPPTGGRTFAGCVETFLPWDALWWPSDRVDNFLRTLAPVHAARAEALRLGSTLAWATAYRRTRLGTPVWELRSDGVSGCLRTAGGGSSRQAVVEAGEGRLAVRWMTPREYARLQGAPTFLFGGARPSAVLSGFGDAVCVPVIAWIAEHYLRPMLDG